MSIRLVGASTRLDAPFWIESRTTSTMIRIDLVESSLPGIGCVKRDGSELLSTRAITGTLSRLASAIAMASL